MTSEAKLCSCGSAARPTALTPQISITCSTRKEVHRHTACVAAFFLNFFYFYYYMPDGGLHIKDQV